MFENNVQVDDSLLSWPKARPLGKELPPVTPFSLEYIPAGFRPLVEDVSERMQTPPDYAAAAAIGVLAGCVNRRAIVPPRANGVSFQKPCNLWGAIIGAPGFMKSPVLTAIARPVFEIERLRRVEFESELSNFEMASEEGDLSLQAWRKVED